MNFIVKSVTPEFFKTRLEAIRKNALEANILNIFKKTNDVKEQNDDENKSNNKETSFASWLESMKNPLDEKLNQLIDSYKEKKDLSVLKEINDHLTNKENLRNNNNNSEVKEDITATSKNESVKLKIDVVPEDKKSKEEPKAFYVSNLAESLEAAKRNNVGVSAVENVIAQTGATEKQKQQMNSNVVIGMNKIIHNIHEMQKKAETKTDENTTTPKLTDFATKPKLPTPFDKK